MEETQTTSIIQANPQWAELFSKIPAHLIDPRDHPRLASTLQGVASGLAWGEIAPGGLSKPEYIWLKHHSKEFFNMAREAEKIADDLRQMDREEVAHHRAVIGERVPTVDRNGNIVDWYNKPSDRLMEVLLKASNPDKYREAKSDNSGPSRVVLQVNLGIPSRVHREKIVEGEAYDSRNEEQPKIGTTPLAGSAERPDSPVPGAKGPETPKTASPQAPENGQATP
ncbi:MAG: hypothetical protein PHV11_08315 [Candidatus Bipolaricaulis sp.]|jgi:hypothetical protein|nr:hypothetical protein [Candidatus Bipolaricaulis sp.]